MKIEYRIFAYEILKLTGHVIQKECQVDPLRYAITEHDVS